MLQSVTRRSVLGAAAMGAVGMAMPLRAQSALPVPTGPMLLTRSLERSLRDGKSIRVVRNWLVAFEQMAERIAVKGSQRGVSVDAPGKLAAFIELEERRDTNAMFPIILSASGLIVNAGSGDDAALIADAVKAGEQAIENAAKSAGEKLSAKAGLMRLQQASETYLSTLPGDLFFPSGKEVRQEQEISLGEGVDGHFSLSYLARPGDTYPWLATAERQVTTVISGNRRISREIWGMAPA